jgi:hypothetical protein
MNYAEPSKHVNIKEYDYIISIGNKCPTVLVLRQLNIYKESFPFDYISSSPNLILKYLKDQTDFYPKRCTKNNVDGCYFGHFDTNSKFEETIETFKKRFDRLLDLLKNKKKILFVYTSEGDVYNDMGNRYSANYTMLNNISDYIKETYEYDDFKILAIHVNRICEDTNNIINFTINVPNVYLSDDGSGAHDKRVYETYRNTLKKLLSSIFKS